MELTRSYVARTPQDKIGPTAAGRNYVIAGPQCRRSSAGQERMLAGSADQMVVGPRDLESRFVPVGRAAVLLSLSQQRAGGNNRPAGNHAPRGTH